MTRANKPCPSLRSGLAATRHPFGDGLREATDTVPPTPNANLLDSPCRSGLRPSCQDHLKPKAILSKESDHLNFT